MKAWCVAHTKIHQERLALDHLHHQGIESYAPCFYRTVKCARKTEEKLTPLFARYIFFSLNLEEQPWRSVQHTKGVLYVLTNKDSKPIQIDHHIIQNIKSQEITQNVVPLSSIKHFAVGQKIRFVNGTFSLKEGEVYDVQHDQQRVCILLNFLGQEVSVYAKADDIEHA